MRIITMILMLFAFTVNGIAQGKVELSKLELKEIKKQVKKYEKQGWTVRPGQKSLLLQQIQSYKWRNEVNDDLTPKWKIFEASGVAKSYEAARYVGLNNIQSEFVRQATYEITEEIKKSTNINDVKGSNPGAGVESIAKLQATESAKSIGQITDIIYPLVEMERTLPNGDLEIQMVFATSGSNFKEVVKNGVNQALERIYKKRNEQIE